MKTGQAEIKKELDHHDGLLDVILLKNRIYKLVSMITWKVCQK